MGAVAAGFLADLLGKLLPDLSGLRVVAGPCACNVTTTVVPARGAARVTVLFTNFHQNPLELCLAGGGAAHGGAGREEEVPMGAVAPGETRELYALSGQVFHILAAPSDPGPPVRKYTVKHSPKRQSLKLKPRERGERRDEL